MKHMIWLDTETTGLKPREGVLLEVAIVVTDLALNEVSSFEAQFQFDKTRARRFCDDKVLEMHEKSGLLDECHRSTNVSTDVEARINEFLDTVAPGERYDRVLAGSTIRFDREWLDDKMPLVLDKVHYRMIDTSGLRYSMIPVTGADFEMPKKKNHRAMADVRESIDEYRYLWGQFFKWQKRGGIPHIHLPE